MSSLPTATAASKLEPRPNVVKAAEYFNEQFRENAFGRYVLDKDIFAPTAN